ncbi:hypothetical protein [Actinophytocola glycyrrhizae]|uniref:Uncharacterized protein n=1 Tax=Actinophytocola glycyrrhizae TaxID=2044873 RepID=A0ABV9RYQ0_9PSEU
MHSEQPWEKLNEGFYTGNPAAYFRRRQFLLVLAATRMRELDEFLEQGISFEGIELKLEPSSDIDNETRLHQAFLVAESEILLHHASEALIRLFLGHEGRPACPWIECSALREPRRFREEVDRLAANTWAPERRREIGHVFLGAAPDEPGEEWNDAVDAVIMLLRLLSKNLNEDANMYNAVKHGMTVIPGEAYIGLSDDSGQAVLGHRGLSVAFLESTKVGKERTWRETTKWCSVPRTLWLIDLALRQMEALWIIASARYVGKPAKGVHVITKDAVRLATTGELASGAPVKRFSRIIGIEQL